MGIFAYLAICCFWGLSSIATKVGLEGFDPFTFSFVRFVIASVILLGVNLYQRKSILLRRNDFKVIVISAFMMYFMNSFFTSFATKRLDAGIIPILFSLVPMMMVIIETILERKLLVGIPGTVGILGGICGIAVVSMGTGKGLPLDLIGLLLMCCGVMTWSIGSLYIKKQKITASITVMLMYQTIVPMIIFGALMMFSGGPSLSKPLWVPFSGILYMTLIDTLIGSACYVYLLKTWKVSIVATYAYINPVVGLIGAYFVLGESITSQKILGMGIILFSVYLIQSDQRLRDKMAIMLRKKSKN